jgi:hypothetical protein
MKNRHTVLTVTRSSARVLLMLKLEWMPGGGLAAGSRGLDVELSIGSKFGYMFGVKQPRYNCSHRDAAHTRHNASVYIQLNSARELKPEGRAQGYMSLQWCGIREDAMNIKDFGECMDEGEKMRKDTRTRRLV